MSTSTHFVAPQEIMAFLDGELSADRTQSVFAHLDECAECRAAAASLSNNSQALSNWTVPAVPANPQFENSVLETSRRISSGQRPASILQVSAFLRRHWLLTAVSSALVAGFVWWLSSFPLASHYEPLEKVSVHLGPRSHVVRSIREAPQGTLGGLIGGAAPDSDGLFHGSAEYGRNSASAKGQAITTQQSPVFTNQMPLATSAPQGGAADSNGPVKAIAKSGTNSFSVDAQLVEVKPQTPMIARTVSLSIIAKDFGSSRTALDAILARRHGYAAGLTANTQQNAARSLQASLRIPAAELNAAVAELKSLGHVENENQSGEEVTQQDADLVARLKNSRETERRLQAILEQRTGKISDVLAVEQEIARVRGEIEQMEAQQKSLEHRVNFATIDLTLAEEYKAQIGSPSPAISTRLHNALITGYRDAVETIVGIILFIAAYGPSILLWLAFLFPVGWLLRRVWLRANAGACSVGA